MQLPGPNQPILEIHTVLGEENIGINHIAFQADDVKKTYDEIHGKGVEFDGKPYRNRHTGRGNVRLRDPDGWRVQLCDAKRKAPETILAKFALSALWLKRECPLIRMFPHTLNRDIM